MDINQLKQQIFYSSGFQEKWKAYLNAFGEDLDGLFDRNYDKKIRFAAGLEHLLQNRLNDAYDAMRHFESTCERESDQQILHRLLALCRNEDAMAGVQVGDWVKKSNGGYCRVVKKTPDYAIIKQGFDSEGTYVKQSGKVECFKITLTDLTNYQLLEPGELSHIKAFFSENPEEENSFSKHTETLLSYRERILKAGFDEAKYTQFDFYRYTTDKVAFVVNLKDLGDWIQITYGFTTIVEEEYFQNNGESDSDIKLRFSAVINNQQDEALAAGAIKGTFDLYGKCSKDEILELKKEKQKAFLQKITNLLKPLGFKKKATKWTKMLEGDYCVEFNAQKSQWSDQFYFNISVYHSKVQYPQCYNTRLRTNGCDIYNWQLLSDEEFSVLMNTAMDAIILPILNTPLSALGERPEIWENCHCKRDKCENCWVQQNMWEAKGRV